MAAGSETSRVPDALTPPRNHPRFPLIDGMRALAALSVLVVHVGLFSGAFGSSFAGSLIAHLNIGVTIFFLISGFLLYRPFVSARRGGPARPSIGRYGWRRMLRIYPAYWVVLTVLVLIPGAIGVAGGDWLNQYAMLGALPLAQGGGPSCVESVTSCGLAQTWSLTVEASFYAALPAFALATSAIGRRWGAAPWPAWELAVLGILSAASVVLAFAGPAGTAASWIAGSFAGYAFWFSLGMGLAIISVGLEDRPLPAAVRLLRRAPAAPWGLALALYLAFSAAMPATPFLLLTADRMLAHLSFGVIALLLMLPAVFGEPGRGLPGRLLSTPALAWLGLISYGIFLWHYAFAVAFGEDLGFLSLLAVTLAGAIACAAASYYLVERPILSLKNLGRGQLPPDPKLTQATG